jgi:hypothetical protein
MDDYSKKIIITGTNNKYHMKKIINQNKLEKETKKRVQSEKWFFPDENYEYSNQLKMIIDISNNNLTYINEELKKMFDEDKFLTFESILNKMIECELKCRYCISEMNVLYDISREMKQWSVDRVDNDLGHNINNFHLACLDCNLKRRRRTDENFLFTKQLNIVKQDK